MNIFRFLSTGLMTLAATAVALPAMATPQISSGELPLDTDFDGCVARVEDYINTLDIQTSINSRADGVNIGASGYFDDGSFRMLCYPNPYGDDSTSLMIIFVAHETDIEVADQFVDVVISQFGN